MQITLHRPDLQRFVEQKVSSGEYTDPGAVVEEALVRLQRDQSDGDWETDELQGAVRVGLEQLARGEGIDLKGDPELDSFFEDLKRAGRERLAQNPNAR